MKHTKNKMIRGVLMGLIVLTIIFSATVYTFAQNPEPYINSAAGGSVSNTNSGAGGSGGNTNSGAGTTVEPNALIPLQNPLKVDSIGGLVKNFVEIISYLAVLAAVLVFIWIGFQFVLAQGKPEKTKELKQWLGWAVVGVAVILGASLIIDVVINTLSATGTVSPNIIESARNANSGN